MIKASYTLKHVKMGLLGVTCQLSNLSCGGREASKILDFLRNTIDLEFSLIPQLPWLKLF